MGKSHVIGEKEIGIFVDELWNIAKNYQKCNKCKDKKDCLAECQFCGDAINWALGIVGNDSVSKGKQW